MPQACRTIDWNSPHMSHTFLQELIQSQEFIKSIKLKDLSPVTYLTRKSVQKFAESWNRELLGLSGRRVMAKLLFWNPEFGFLPEGSWSQLRHKSRLDEFLQRCVRHQGGASGWAWHYVTHACTKLRDIRPVEILQKIKTTCIAVKPSPPRVTWWGCSSGWRARDTLSYNAVSEGFENPCN